nr:SUPPRESSOR OF ABI3-5 isoform X1 [Ipomoea batatas]
MSNVLSMWKQRSHEGQAPRVALDESQTVAEDRSHSVGPAAKTKLRTDSVATRETATTAGFAAGTTVQQPMGIESQDRAVTNSSGVTLKGVIRGSGLGVVKKDTLYTGSLGSSTSHSATGSSLLINSDVSTSPMPSRTDTSAMSSYTPPASAGGGKRRFSEMPSQPFPDKEQPSNITYRDRAAERRSLYGSSSFGDNLSDHGDSNRDSTSKRGVFDPTPFPPGVGGGRVPGDANSQSYEIITSDRAIDESNVGNRMLRNMGWQEGLGLGKDGSGMVEPVQAQSMDSRAGLGSQPKKLDPSLEAQAGDSYKTLIQKKAIARFREMS